MKKRGNKQNRSRVAVENLGTKSGTSKRQDAHDTRRVRGEVNGSRQKKSPKD